MVETAMVLLACWLARALLRVRSIPSWVPLETLLSVQMCELAAVAPQIQFFRCIDARHDDINDVTLPGA
jgi:hypothetical protein